ncbi:MAG TPA: ATP-binding cassette domain-containing protein, partial [Trebonia sp.]|nr:ATP-binding cassette domain-containing protein [Trebonia sp.]
AIADRPNQEEERADDSERARVSAVPAPGLLPGGPGARAADPAAGCRPEDGAGHAADVLPPRRPAPAGPRSEGENENHAHVRFDHVSFAYPASPAPVLRDVCLDVARGETLVITGATGSGKTTLLQLVPRLADVTAGRVLLGGTDVRDIPLRARVGCAFEEATLFSASVRENVTFGAAGAAEEEIEAALTAAQARFAYDLPWGLDTRIGEQGNRYETFSAEYEKAAAQLTGVGTEPPSRAQYFRWVAGQLKGGLPYPDACRVLEAMFAPWTAADLFGPAQPALTVVPVQVTPEGQAPARIRRLPGGSGTDPEWDEFLAWRAARRLG